MTSTSALSPWRRLYAAYPPAFWVVWVGTLINRVGEFVVPLLGFYLSAERGLSLGQVGLILSAMGIGRFVSEPLGGALSDRFGTAVTMRLSLAGGGLMLLLLAQARTFAELFGGVLAFALFQSMYKPAVSSAVAGLTQGPQRTRAYNLLYWAINVGASVAPVLGGWLAGVSFRLVFWLDAAAMFIYALLLTLRFPNTRPERRPPAAGAAARGLGLPRDRLLWQFCLATLLYSLTYQGYKLLALVFAEAGYTAAQYGQVLAVNGVLVVLLGLPLGHLIARDNHPRWQPIGAALLGLGFLGHAFAATLWAHMLAVVVWTVGEIVAYSISKTVISELGRPEQRGRYIGLVGSMAGLAGLLAPLLGAALLEQAGAAPMWFVLAGLGFASAGLYMVLEGRIQTRRAEMTALEPI
ncbi:MFS transporter [Deinococcus piscis]|uniref:MFS transporter n=1 Tax=Deinococcus piscis TaxID=394230 RepID=A0ABQ3JYN0_9DEIO|nr:MFS transporter [Deinococcus piscis]GHF93738.1 MFS transporter [Deinococcus piscis]